jgi:hypothetical protein
MRERDELRRCAKCRSPFCRRIASVPAIVVWNTERAFPNLGHFKDKTFPSKAAYEGYLKDQGIAETAHDGKVKRPHGTKVIARI